MDIKRKKRIILFIFVLIWIFLAYLAYGEYQKTQQKLSEQQIFLAAQEKKENVGHQSSQQERVSDKNTFFEKEDFGEKIAQQEQEQILSHGNISVSEEVLQYFERQQELQKYHSSVNKKDTSILTQEQTQNERNFFEESIPKICGKYPCFSAKDFLDTFNLFEETTGDSFADGIIYDGKEADIYLKNIAERRGYEKRTLAPQEKLVSLGKLKTLNAVKSSYVAMRNEMKEQGITLHFVSGYRSFVDQRAIFKRKMGAVNAKKIPTGVYDEKIMKVLNLSALPGYSKHHTGYAVDFGCGADYLVYQFAETACYKWMSKNNFENAKRFGFLPSYPNGVIDQGPNPEPWEYVWVGEEFIKNQKL